MLVRVRLVWRDETAHAVASMDTDHCSEAAREADHFAISILRIVRSESFIQEI